MNNVQVLSNIVFAASANNVRLTHYRLITFSCLKYHWRIFIGFWRTLMFVIVKHLFRSVICRVYVCFTFQLDTDTHITLVVTLILEMQY